MGSNKNNQNKNQPADSQTTVVNNDEQKTDAANTAAVQSADEQQNAAPAQPSADEQSTATEQPKDDTAPQDSTNAGSNSVNNSATQNSPVVPELPPKDEKGVDETPPAESKTATETVTMTLRHKSHTPRYHRCGLTLTKVFADYEVPADCVERIKGDKWIEVKGAK